MDSDNIWRNDYILVMFQILEGLCPLISQGSNTKGLCS